MRDRVRRHIERSRALYPAVEIAREMRQPFRDRYAASRRGLELGRLASSGTRCLCTHPWAALTRAFGAGDPRGPVWAVTMVKNEEVRIEGAIRNLLEGGVDQVVVADNLSTDSTPEILAELARQLPVAVVADREPAYFQGPKMSLLARLAARNGASWVIPFDADELWHGVGAPIAELLATIDADAISVPVFDFLPSVDMRVVDDPFHALTRRTVTPVTHKTAFRAHLFAAIATGNHSVSQPARVAEGVAQIRHYPFLGFDHFVTKSRDGNVALVAGNLPSDLGEHWRTWGAADDEEIVEHWRTELDKSLVDDPLPKGRFIETND